MTPSDLWNFLPVGYLTTIAIEAPILLIALSASHPTLRRMFAGVWLTSCTYPIVVLVLPLLLPTRTPHEYLLYIVIAEIFAPLAECILLSPRWV